MSLFNACMLNVLHVSCDTFFLNERLLRMGVHAFYVTTYTLCYILWKKKKKEKKRYLYGCLMQLEGWSPPTVASPGHVFFRTSLCVVQFLSGQVTNGVHIFAIFQRVSFLSSGMRTKYIWELPKYTLHGMILE